MATQALMFLVADIEGSAAIAQRLWDAGVAADHRRRFRAGRAGHGR